MKKLYSILAALLVVISATALVTLPYELSTITDALKGTVDDDAWTYSCPSNNQSWAKFGSGTTASYRIWCTNPDATQDTWLVSPAFATKAGEKFKITFKFQLHSDDTEFSNVDVHFTTKSPLEDAEAAAASTKGFEWTDLKGSTPGLTTTKEYTFEAKADAEGKAYIAFHAYGTFYRGIYMRGCKIESLGVEQGGGGDDPDPVDPVDPGEHECAGVQVPYSSSIAVSSSSFDEGWTNIDANGDGGDKQWKPYSDTSKKLPGVDGSVLCARYNYSSSNDADDYLVSPAIHFDAGKEYKILYWWRTDGSDKEDVTIYASTGNTPDEIKAGIVVHDFAAYSNNSYHQIIDDFKPEKTGDYHITFYIHSPKFRYNVFVTNFQVVENVFAPAPVSALTATPAPERELKCTLAWTLPTTDVFGAPLTAEQTVEKIEIYRDGAETPVATLGGDATTWDDTEATGLTSGRHTYKVTVTVAGVSQEAKVGPTGYVGPLVPAPVPCTFPIGTKDEFEMWTKEKGENSTIADMYNWYFDESSSGNSARYTAAMNTTEDDWFFTPPVAVTEPGYYRATIEYHIANANGAKLQGAVGREAKSTAMTVVCDALPLYYESYSDRHTADFDFYASEAGTYYLGLHCAYANRASANNYYIYKLDVTTSKAIPAPVAGLKAEPDGENLAANVSFFVSENSFAGNPMAPGDYKVEIYRGDELVKTLRYPEFNVGTAEASLNTVNVDVPAAGAYTFTVKTVALDGTTAPTHPSVTVSWVGPRQVSLPYSIDFYNDSNDPSMPTWQFIDANQDGNTWENKNYSGYQVTPGAIVASGDEETLYAYEDYIVSPYFACEPGYYKATYKVRGGNKPYYGDPEPVYYRIGVIKYGSFDGKNTEFVAVEQREQSTTTLTDKEFGFSIPEAGNYQFVFAADVPNAYVQSYNYLGFRGLSVESNPIVPGIATEVTVTPAPDGVLEATVSWLNPTDTNHADVTLNEGDIVKAVIIRDGEEVGTVTDGLTPGATSQWVDNTLTQSGRHKYAVEVYTIAGKSKTAATVVESEWIGSGLSVPYLAGSDEFTDWTIVNVDNDYKYVESWDGEQERVDLTWQKSYRGLTLSISSKNANDWAISPLVKLEPDCIYKLTTKCYWDYYSDGTYTLHIYAGAGDDYTAYGKIYDAVIPADSKGTSTMTEAVAYVSTVTAEEAAMLLAEGDATEGTEGEGTEGGETAAAGSLENPVKILPGNLHMGIYSAGSGSIVVNHFDVELQEKIDTGVEGVTADNGTCYAGGEIRFAGVADVKVYSLAGALVKSETAEGSVSLDDLEAGVYIVAVKTATASVTIKIAK